MMKLILQCVDENAKMQKYIPYFSHFLIRGVEM